MNKEKNSTEKMKPESQVDTFVKLKDLKIGDIISFEKYSCHYKAVVGKVIGDRILCHWFDINDRANETVISFEDILESKASG